MAALYPNLVPPEQLELLTKAAAAAGASSYPPAPSPVPATSTNPQAAAAAAILAALSQSQSLAEILAQMGTSPAELLVALERRGAFAGANLASMDPSIASLLIGRLAAAAAATASKPIVDPSTQMSPSVAAANLASTAHGIGGGGSGGMAGLAGVHLSKSTPASLAMSIGSGLGQPGGLNRQGLPVYSSASSSIGGGGGAAPSIAVSGCDPLAFNKAILFGDFCTAQQLAAAGNNSNMPAVSSASGLTLHRTADYSDPAYIHSRALDPSLLPMPSTGRRSAAAYPAAGGASSAAAIKQASRPLVSTTSAGFGDPAPLQTYRKHPSSSSSQSTPSSASPPLGQRREAHRHHGTQPGVGRQSPVICSRAPSTGQQFSASSSHAESASRPIYCPVSPCSPKNEGRGSRQGNHGASSYELADALTRTERSDEANAVLAANIANFVDQANRTYQDEVERYTSRDRSDSMRTRTSSEASQMLAAVRSIRQRTGAFGGLPYAPGPLYCPSYADALSLTDLADRFQASEILATYSSMAAAAAAAASQTQAPTTTASRAAEGIFSRRHEPVTEMSRTLHSPDHGGYPNIRPASRDADRSTHPPPAVHHHGCRKTSFTTATTSGAVSADALPSRPLTSSIGSGQQRSHDSYLGSDCPADVLSAANLMQSFICNAPRGSVDFTPEEGTHATHSQARHGPPPNANVGGTNMGQPGDPRLLSAAAAAASRHAVAGGSRLSPHHSSVLVPGSETPTGADTIFRPPEPHLTAATAAAAGNVVGTLGAEIEKAIAEGIKPRPVADPPKVRLKSPQQHQSISLLSEVGEHGSLSSDPVCPKKRNRLSSSHSSSNSSITVVASPVLHESPSMGTATVKAPRLSSAEEHSRPASATPRTASGKNAPTLDAASVLQPGPAGDQRVVPSPTSSPQAPSRSLTTTKSPSDEREAAEEAERPTGKLTSAAAACAEQSAPALMISQIGDQQQQQQRFSPAASVAGQVGRNSKSPAVASFSVSPSSGADSPGNLQICLPTDEEPLQSPTAEARSPCPSEKTFSPPFCSHSNPATPSPSRSKSSTDGAPATSS
ncbi:Gei-8p [Sparganum proliferum]